MANKSKYPQGCGIYAIENIESGKRYVGSSQNMERRLPTHVWKLRKGIHHSAHLQAAWNLYGESAFRFVLVLRCETEQQLLDCEQLEIEMQNTVEGGYNMARFAGAPMRGRKQTEETKEKMRLAHANRQPISEETRERLVDAAIEREQDKKDAGYAVSDETRLKLSEAGIGREVSEETREKIRLANSGKPLSDEHRQKLSEAHMGREPTEAEILGRAVTVAKNTGKKRSPEFCAKMAEMHGNRSEETKQKMRESRIKFLESKNAENRTISGAQG